MLLHRASILSVDFQQLNKPDTITYIAVENTDKVPLLFSSSPGSWDLSFQGSLLCRLEPCSSKYLRHPIKEFV